MQTTKGDANTVEMTDKNWTNKNWLHVIKRSANFVCQRKHGETWLKTTQLAKILHNLLEAYV